MESLMAMSFQSEQGADNSKIAPVATEQSPSSLC